jgi:hypothetical protein
MVFGKKNNYNELGNTANGITLPVSLFSGGKREKDSKKIVIVNSHHIFICSLCSFYNAVDFSFFLKQMQWAKCFS